MTQFFDHSRLFLTGARMIVIFLCAALASASDVVDGARDPYHRQAALQINNLGHSDAGVRFRAAEALGYLRYYPAQDGLIAALKDGDERVRRNAALSLGVCGGRAALLPLVDALDDHEWTVAQAAWVSLINLTGMDFPFDGLGDPDVQRQQRARWRQWVDTLPSKSLSEDIVELLDAETHEAVERGLRAMGALGGPGSSAKVLKAIAHWETIDTESEFAAKGRVQAGIRALGRLGEPEGLDALDAFLNNRQWARYAAEALGDFGGEDAATLLLNAFPLYAQGFDRPGSTPHTHSEDIPHLDWSDRLLATPYAIAMSLSRIPFESPENLDRLRGIAFRLATQVPLDIDGLVVYDEEPFQTIVRHLLDKVDMSQAFVDAAFTALGQERELPSDSPIFIGASVDGSPPQSDVDRSKDPSHYTLRDSWHETLFASWPDYMKHARAIPFDASPVMRGQEEPQRLAVDVSGWDKLYLIVDDVENYSMDRANWAEARLIADDGTVTYLDTLTPMSATQQHDVLRQVTNAHPMR